MKGQFSNSEEFSTQSIDDCDIELTDPISFIPFKPYCTYTEEFGMSHKYFIDGAPVTGDNSI